MKKIIKKTAVKKAQSGSKVSVSKLRKVSDSLNYVGNQKLTAGMQRAVKGGSDDISRELVRRGNKDISNANRYDSISNAAMKKVKSKK